MTSCAYAIYNVLTHRYVIGFRSVKPLLFETYEKAADKILRLSAGGALTVREVLRDIP